MCKAKDWSKSWVAVGREAGVYFVPFPTIAAVFDSNVLPAVGKGSLIQPVGITCLSPHSLGMP